MIRDVFRRGLAASLRRHRGEPLGLGERVICWIAGLLFAKIRRKLGGHLKYAISGSATLSREVGELIDGLGIEVYEGYGLTETSPIVTMNSPAIAGSAASAGRSPTSRSRSTPAAATPPARARSSCTAPMS